MLEKLGIKLPDFTPAQLYGGAAAIVAGLADLGVQASIGIVLPCLAAAYIALVFADAHLRHGRAAALPSLVAEVTAEIARDTHSKQLAQVAKDVSALAGRVDQAEAAVKQAGQPIDVQNVANQVIEQVTQKLAAPPTPPAK
jgi:uncharacterized membrane protein